MNIIRFNRMTRPSPHRDQSPAEYQVELPRRDEAIGGALRNAYGDDLGLPDDMLAMLRQLNGATTRHY